MEGMDPRKAGDLIREAIEAARELPRPDHTTIADPRDKTLAPVILDNDGLRAIPVDVFDRYRLKPLARTGQATLTTLASFIDHANRFKLPNSVVFAHDDMADASLGVVFDYHPQVTETVDEAANLRHRSRYAFPFSDEWKAWQGKDGEPMAMADFAAFLEDRIVDVVSDAQPSSEPAKTFLASIQGKMATATKLIELARGLQVYENSVLKEARNLSSGEGQLTFDSEHLDADGKPLSVPNVFMICIPIFSRSPEYYRLLARLRYRKTPGGVVFWYELWRVDLAFEQAFLDACERVREQTGLPLLVGEPER